MRRTRSAPTKRGAPDPGRDGERRAARPRYSPSTQPKPLQWSQAILPWQL